MLWTWRSIDVDAADAWRIFTDTDRWAEWGPSVRGATIDPPGRFETGATGTVQTALGPSLPFELTDVVEGKRWSWRVGGVPATSHRVEATATGCRVGFGVPAIVAPYLAVCRWALVRIDRSLTSAT